VSLVHEDSDFVDVVRDFVRDKVMPVADEYEHADEYPGPLVEQMAQMGLFGATIPEEFGGVGLSAQTYSRIVEEISAGWMSLAGVINSHLIMAFIIERFGTHEQRSRYLPMMASGEFRGSLGLSEADAGSDAAALRTKAARDGDGYLINGSKMWVTNGRRGSGMILAAKTDSSATPASRGISLFIAERGQGYDVQRDHDKLGYKGVETCEIVFTNYRVDEAQLLGGSEGHGFAQVLAGLELGRINVASRAVGVARAAFDQALGYAQQRETFGKQIAQHQTIQNYLADMATNLEAARLLTHSAAKKFDRGERADLEAGMAKLFATETASANALLAMRIHGGFGFTKEFQVERLYRDAPLMLIGEGTSEIQRLVIARSLLGGARS
jgi:alkylation response protein AidB-like acyl-CoA dehydrogenase